MDDGVTRSIRETYDRLAPQYADHLFDELENKPFDRAILDRFAAEVGSIGEVCDLGCGPGHVARYLRGAGARVFGVDLSPRMIEAARLRSPGIEFRVGDMMALEISDQALDGMVAFYAIVNIPKRSLPMVFREMMRVLKPGAPLLLSFHVGDETLQPKELWGHAVAMDFYLFPVAMIEDALKSAGFISIETLEREPYGPEVEYQSRRAYVFARNAGAAALQPVASS